MIDDAVARGEMEPSEGVGRPLRLDDDPAWWVRSFLERERLPDRHAAAVAVRQEGIARAVRARGLDEARSILADVNGIVRAWNEEAPAAYRLDEATEVWLLGARAGRPPT